MISSDCAAINSTMSMCNPEIGIGIEAVNCCDFGALCVLVMRSLLINRKCGSLTAYCPKLRLCLKRRKQRMAEMTVWVRVKRKRDAFTPLLSLCCKRHTALTLTHTTQTLGMAAGLRHQRRQNLFISFYPFNSSDLHLHVNVCPVQ